MGHRKPPLGDKPADASATELPLNWLCLVATVRSLVTQLLLWALAEDSKPGKDSSADAAWTKTQEAKGPTDMEASRPLATPARNKAPVPEAEPDKSSRKFSDHDEADASDGKDDELTTKKKVYHPRMFTRKDVRNVDVKHSY